MLDSRHQSVVKVLSNPQKDFLSTTHKKKDYGFTHQDVERVCIDNKIKEFNWYGKYRIGSQKRSLKDFEKNNKDEEKTTPQIKKIKI